MGRKPPLGSCQRCGFTYYLTQLVKEWTGLRVCGACRDAKPAETRAPSYKPEGVPLRTAAPKPPERHKIKLQHLTLNPAYVLENAAPGKVIGTLTDPAANGAALTLSDSDEGRVALSGTSLIAGLSNIDYEEGRIRKFTVRQTLEGAVNSPLDTTIYYEVMDVYDSVAAPLPLGAFYFNQSSQSGLLIALLEDI